MSYLEIILPFGIPPAIWRNNYCNSLKAPSLAYLLSYAKRDGDHAIERICPLTPSRNIGSMREKIVRDLGKPKMMNRYNSPAVAQSLMKAFGLDAQLSADREHFGLLQPVHIHVARDHLVLTDISRLQSVYMRLALFVAEQICQRVRFHLVLATRRRGFACRRLA